jgi:DNA repair exonuclease SbcCD ATPase subunit
MPENPSEALLEAEEEAHQLVEVLRQLKNEVESYRTARRALDEAALSIRDLVTRAAEIAERLAGVAETMKSIGTPELLRGLESTSNELAALRGAMEKQQVSLREQILEEIRQDRQAIQGLGARLRSLVLGGVGLSLVTLTLLAWLFLRLG